MSQFLKWAAEMDRAASVAEAESDGSPQFLAIIDGNRAIAEVLRQGAALEAAIAHATAQFDEVDAKRADDAPCSADSHFREAVRTIARTLPPSTAKVDRAAIWGELREMDRLHVDNAKLAADLAAAEDAISALDCHYGATEELGHDCKDASPCMREVLESERDTALADLAATKAKLAALVEACRSAETILGNMAKETGRTFGRWEIHHEPLRNDAQRMLPLFRAAIAAAKGGMS